MHLSQEIARFSATRQLSCGLRPDRLLVDQNWTKKSNEADFAERKYHLSAYFFGGARRDRTADLLHAMQALSQLSYGPLARRHSKASLLEKQYLLTVGPRPISGVSRSALVRAGRR